MEKTDKAVTKQWSEKAYRFMCKFAKTKKGVPFLAEDVREAYVFTGNTAPHDNRAWGAVFRRAVKEKIVTQCGYAPSRTGHGRPMPQWAVIN